MFFEVPVKHKKLFFAIIGFVAGMLNGLFGSGGGVVVVPGLELSGTEPKKAHATSVAVILALSVVSAVAFILMGNVKFMDMLIYLPGGLFGGFIGAKFLRSIDNLWLKRIFGVLMMISGIKLVIG